VKNVIGLGVSPARTRSSQSLASEMDTGFSDPLLPSSDK